MLEPGVKPIMASSASSWSQVAALTALSLLYGISPFTMDPDSRRNSSPSDTWKTPCRYLMAQSGLTSTVRPAAGRRTARRMRRRSGRLSSSSNAQRDTWDRMRGTDSPPAARDRHANRRRGDDQCRQNRDCGDGNRGESELSPVCSTSARSRCPDSMRAAPVRVDSVAGISASAAGV